ncbi:MAG: DNA mismatch endonuclease Vsr [Myxococcales bacterium]|nr:DNA mismatch endonuclease Vsr [Myxococcales bacterium]
MTDRLSSEQRSRLMSRVRNKNTAPEIKVRSVLHRMGYRFRLHRRDLPGQPDIVLPRHRKAIFVHGCFWHQHRGCRKSARPTTRTKFWNDKLDGNVRRDTESIGALRRSGWTPLVVWECQVGDEKTLRKSLHRFLSEEHRRVVPK